ncbi:MAG TPA: ParA family protein [Hellea balneolensis]|uniref:Chromosome partitioning protein ParA n=1 Tax=Hellea balneolensis TaxID=287478 RepID=A0A7C3GKG6_9PROT|nr:ParA family protein [Hellea balneolensis]
MSTRIIAIVNQKGGVGKTTTSINLATALTLLGQKVLLMDLDPQGNATTGLGVRRGQTEITLYDVIVEEAELAGACVNTNVENLTLIPSDMDMSGAELAIGTAGGRTTRLKSALHTYISGLEAQNARPDYVLIDCPPALGLLTVNALAAAHSVIVPLQCEFFALEGLSQLLKTVEMAKAQINPALTIDGVMLTMYDRRNRLSDQVVQDVRKHLGRAVFNTIIPRNVRVAEAPSYGKPVLLYDPRCAGSKAYMELGKEIIAKRRTRRSST